MNDGGGNGAGLAPVDLFRATQHGKVLGSVPKDHVIVAVVCAPIVETPTGPGYALDLAMKVAADTPVCRPAPALLVAALVKAWSDTVWENATKAASRLVRG